MQNIYNQLKFRRENLLVKKLFFTMMTDIKALREQMDDSLF